jgi:hypothetical protein
MSDTTPLSLQPLYGSMSYCHKQPSLIVRSREQGFVTQNCLECGEPRFLPFDELPTLSCESCKSEFTRFKNERKNYAYRCEPCAIDFELASIVPHWNERFEYHGFGLDSDYLWAHSSAPALIYINVRKLLRNPH